MPSHAIIGRSLQRSFSKADVFCCVCAPLVVEKNDTEIYTSGPVVCYLACYWYYTGTFDTAWYC